MRAKLIRLTNINRKPIKNKRNSINSNVLQKEVKKLQQVTASKRAEIAQILYSDRASIINELQEQSKLLHCELHRTMNEKISLQDEVKQLQAQLNKEKLINSQAIFQKQTKQIRNLIKQIGIQKERNKKISSKLEEAKMIENNLNGPTQKQQMKEKIQELQNQIKSVKNEIQQIDQEMIDIKEVHANQIKLLRKEL